MYHTRCYCLSTHQVVPIIEEKNCHFRGYAFPGVMECSQAGISSKTLVCPGELVQVKQRKNVQRISLWVGSDLVFVLTVDTQVGAHQQLLNNYCWFLFSWEISSLSQFLCPEPIKVSLFCQLFPITEIFGEFIRDVLGLQLRVYPFLSVCLPGHHWGNFYEVYEWNYLNS